jgi:formylmethanofuran dehydrogenase subunit C
MQDGLIEVQGDVGDCVGSSLRGEQAGMRGGTIIIHGSAGVELGAHMSDGFIKVDGSVGLFAGVGMQGGTILIGGDSEGRLGAGMRGGKIILLGRVASILPGFQAEEVRSKAKAGGEKIAGPFYVFSGDMVERGSGRLFISASKNPHLKYKESFMW